MPAGRALLFERNRMTSDRILLELKAVTKSFGPTTVLENIDLAVRDGEFITILGPSGSGKTTILRMIGGFTQPSSGEILLDGPRHHRACPSTGGPSIPCSRTTPCSRI